MSFPEPTPVAKAPTDQRAPRLTAAIAAFRGNELARARAELDALGAGPAAAADGAALDAQARYWSVRVARREEHPERALQEIHAGLAAARRAQQHRTECLLRAELVHVLSSIGQNSDALEQADAAMQRATALQDAVGLAAAHEALASVYWMTDDWALGLAAYTTAFGLAAACGDAELRVLCTMGLAATEEGVGERAAEAGHAEQALAHYGRSLQYQYEGGRLAAALGDRYLQMYCELNAGCSLHSMQRLDEAQRAFESLLANPAHDAVHGNALTMLGRIAQERGDAALALQQLQQALVLTERMNKPFPILVALHALVDAHEAVGDPAAALATMRRYHALHVKNTSDKALRLSRALSVKYETERALAVAQAQRRRADDLERSNADLAFEAAQHERASLEDALTGLANRRRFDQAMRALGPAGGAMRRCSVALLDIDHFKLINDRHSHLVGDQVLRQIGALLHANCRREDLAARFGGEEFVLLAGELGADTMRPLCERLRVSIEQHDWSALAVGLAVTVSIGIAHSGEIAPAEGGDAAAALLAAADTRLYRAKAGGRNRVCGHDGESESSADQS